MVQLRCLKDFQAVRGLPFCYLCGRDFVPSDETNRDHVPPTSAFNLRDRTPPLKLKTHMGCHTKFDIADTKTGQLIALQWGKTPRSAKNRALKFVRYGRPNIVALENLDVDAAVWRWVFGFHAALYRRPLDLQRGDIQTPFPRADKIDGKVVLRPLPPQHLIIVDTVKRNRVHNNVDRIVSNNGKLTYECVWCKCDNDVGWLCMFALDIYNWKVLGSHTSEFPARGCAGLYMLPDGSTPEHATRDHAGTVLITNREVLDAVAP
jgi:hypothetical protein